MMFGAKALQIVFATLQRLVAARSDFMVDLFRRGEPTQQKTMLAQWVLLHEVRANLFAPLSALQICPVRVSSSIQVRVPLAHCDIALVEIGVGSPRDTRELPGGRAKCGKGPLLSLASLLQTLSSSAFHTDSDRGGRKSRCPLSCCSGTL